MIRWKIKDRNHWHWEKGDVWDVGIFTSEWKLLTIRESSKEDAIKKTKRYLDISIHENLDEKLLEFIEDAENCI